jgi:LytR cell envelope-related transcriptional attenuator
MELIEVVERAGYLAGAASLLGMLFLIPLYVSQRRDLHRLRVWADFAPHAPEEAETSAATDVRLAHEAAFTEAAAAAATDRASRRAARSASRGEPVPAAARVRGEAPASRRTMPEGTSVYHEPRWRTWIRRGPTTRELLMVMAGAFAIGLVIVVGSQLLFVGGADPPPAETAGGTGVVKEDVEVAVLNGTAVTGLAGAVADDVEANGYFLGAVTNSPTPADETVVLYERGHEEEAKVVANDLGVSVVQLIDAESRELAEGADVVVVAGEDRAQA